MTSTFVRAPLFALVALPAAALAASEHPAQACGGCFSRPTETTVVTDHRMALSISPQQTVLWDQIEYSGSPSDFSWVLPVRSGTVVQASHDEWFEALDATTSPVINGPVRSCNSGGIGCGGLPSSAGAGFAADTSAGGGVQILSQSVVGPYDTVTLKATDPNALETWLNANGYALPDSFRPTIGAYVAGGFDFIALRLQPGQGVQAMKPVRVVTQGADVLLPLRMVAAGVGAQVGITLYVISEGRYEAATPFFNATVDDSKLTWSASQNRSNYQDLSQKLMQGHSGHTWLTEFSGEASLIASIVPGNGPCGAGGGSYFGGQSLADAYLSQCPCSGPFTCSPSLGGLPPLATAVDGAAETSTDASDDTGELDGPPSLEGGDATSTPDSAIYDATGQSPDASCFSLATCSDFDDLTVAMVGLHPASTWVTRLRAILAVNALAEGDLELQASSSQTPVSNIHSANVYDDPGFSPCGNKGGCSASAEDQNPFGRWLAAAMFVFAATTLVRRRSRRG